MLFQFNCSRANLLAVFAKAREDACCLHFMLSHVAVELPKCQENGATVFARKYRVGVLLWQLDVRIIDGQRDMSFHVLLKSYPGFRAFAALGAIILWQIFYMFSHMFFHVCWVSKNDSAGVIDATQAPRQH